MEELLKIWTDQAEERIPSSRIANVSQYDMPDDWESAGITSETLNIIARATPMLEEFYLIQAEKYEHLQDVYYCQVERDEARPLVEPGSHGSRNPGQGPVPKGPSKKAKRWAKAAKREQQQAASSASASSD